MTDTFINVLSYILVAIYLLILIISLGIFVPKRLGAKYAQGCSRGLVNFVSFIMTILTPFTAITTLFANIVLRIFGIDPKEELLNVTEEEIISIVNEGHEQGVLEEREAEMISNIMELDEKTAGDVMIHRKHIVAVDGMWSLEKTVEFILDCNYSRFPVYIDDIDNIIGILHLRDAMSYYHSTQNREIPVKDLKQMLMSAVFIPESRNVDDLFKDMQKNKTHMQVVVDEYGQTSGIIAMEDILEEIVGNIWDEYDVEEENITAQSDGSYLIKGLTTLEEMADVFEDDFDNEDYDTLNGFLISKLERIPDEGEKPALTIDGYTYQILSVKDRMISLVKMTKVITDNDELQQEA
jgi:putative hemolysin